MSTAKSNAPIGAPVVCIPMVLALTSGIGFIGFSGLTGKKKFNSTKKIYYKSKHFQK